MSPARLASGASEESEAAGLADSDAAFASAVFSSAGETCVASAYSDMPKPGFRSLHVEKICVPDRLFVERPDAICATALSDYDLVAHAEISFVHLVDDRGCGPHVIDIVLIQVIHVSLRDLLDRDYAHNHHRVGPIKLFQD